MTNCQSVMWHGRTHSWGCNTWLDWVLRKGCISHLQRCLHRLRTADMLQLHVSLQHGCTGAGLCHCAAPPPLPVWFHAVLRDTGSFRRHKWTIDQCGGALLPTLLWAAETLHNCDWRGLWKRLNGLRIGQKGRRAGPALWALPIKGEVYSWTGWDPWSMTDSLIHQILWVPLFIHFYLPTFTNMFPLTGSGGFGLMLQSEQKIQTVPFFPPTESHTPDFLLWNCSLIYFISLLLKSWSYYWYALPDYPANI